MRHRLLRSGRWTGERGEGNMIVSTSFVVSRCAEGRTNEKFKFFTKSAPPATGLPGLSTDLFSLLLTYVRSVKDTYHGCVRVRPEVDFIQRCIVRTLRRSRFSNWSPNVSQNRRIESTRERSVCGIVRLSADPVIVFGLVGIQLD